MAFTASLTRRKRSQKRRLRSARLRRSVSTLRMQPSSRERTPDARQNPAHQLASSGEPAQQTQSAGEAGVRRTKSQGTDARSWFAADPRGTGAADGKGIEECQKKS